MSVQLCPDQHDARRTLRCMMCATLRSVALSVWCALRCMSISLQLASCPSGNTQEDTSGSGETK
eukprot:1162118-Pelagomonas_calceolata.AAC.7